MHTLSLLLLFRTIFCTIFAQFLEHSYKRHPQLFQAAMLIHHYLKASLRAKPSTKLHSIQQVKWFLKAHFHVFFVTLSITLICLNDTKKQVQLNVWKLQAAAFCVSMFGWPCLRRSLNKPRGIHSKWFRLGAILFTNTWYCSYDFHF